MRKVIDNNHNASQTYPCTDLGNMQRFIDQHRDYTRCTPSGTWLKWTGQRWKQVTQADIFNLARETVHTIEEEVARAVSHAEASELRRWALSSQSEAKIRSMISMSGKHADIQVKLSDFDRDKTKINCLNGIIDLTSGQLLPRSADNYVSKIIKTEYNPYAKAPRFESFIKQIFGGDQELVGWVQRALGYTLTGSRDEQLLFTALGTGANGKSTLIEVVARLLNDYATTVSFNTFIIGKSSDVRSMEAIGKLKGMRLALASEADSTRKFREDLIKQMTGDAVLQGAKLHGESFTFTPQFTLWFLVNQLPFVRDGSHGFWRRVKIIPFNQRFDDHERDNRLPERLWQEREGILAWLVKGSVGYHKALAAGGSTGLGPCKVIDNEVDQYRYDNDLPSRFLDECTRRQKGTRVGARELFEHYRNWCQHLGENDMITEAIFSKRMQERDLTKTRSNVGMVYKDVVTVNNNHFDNQEF